MRGTGDCLDSFPCGRIGNDAESKAGIGANDVGAFLRLGKSVVVSDGWPVSGDFVSLGNNTSVFDVFANNLTKGSGVVIRGTTGTPVLPLTAPFCPIPTLTCGSTPVTLQLAESKTLGPGAYGALTMPNGSSLTLTGGTYSFCSIRTGRNVTNVQGAGNGTINVLGDVRLANGSELLWLATSEPDPAPGSPPTTGTHPGGAPRG